MSKWEEEFGREYRAEHKRTHYDAVTVQFLKDAPDGLTKARVQHEASDRGLSIGTYIKNLIRKDIGISEE